MLDVFRIGVHIGMTSNSGQVLGVLLRDLGKAEGAVAAVNSGLVRMKGLAVGALAALGGAAALRGLWDIVKAGREPNRELERTRQLGGDFAASLPQTRARAFEVASQVPTSAPSDNVKVLRELGTQLQNNDAARDILPMAQRAAYVIHNFTGEAVEDVVKNLVKVADIRAQIFRRGPNGEDIVDPAKVRSEFDAAARGLILGGGYINSSALVAMARQAGVPAKTMTQEAFYAAMVEAAVSQGAARAGTSTTSLFSQLVGGTMPVHVAAEMTRMGLMKQGEWRSDHGHPVMNPEVSKRFEAAMKDPMAFITGPLNDLMEKQHLTAEQKIAEVFKLFGRQATQRLVAEGLSAEPQFARARRMFHEIPAADAQYKELQARDLDTNVTSFSQAWKGLMQALGEPGVPVAIRVLQGLTEGLHKITEWAVANPDTARHLMEAGAALAGLAAIVGGAAVLAMLGPGGYLLAIGTGAVAAAAGLSKLHDVLQNFLPDWLKPSKDAEGKTTLDKMREQGVQVPSWWPAPAGSGNTRDPGPGLPLKQMQDQMRERLLHKQSFTSPADAEAPRPRQISYIPPATGAAVTRISVPVHLDGRQITEVVAEHMARRASLPPSGASAYDPRMTPAYPGNLVQV